MKVRLHSNAIVARIAAYKLKEKSVAVTIGKHIYLYGINKESFLADKHWICHELAHVKQYQQYGFLRFLFLYLKESLKKGYLNNRFEVDARNSEKDLSLLDKYELV